MNYWLILKSLNIILTKLLIELTCLYAAMTVLPINRNSQPKQLRTAKKTITENLPTNHSFLQIANYDFDIFPPPHNFIIKLFRNNPVNIIYIFK